MAGNADIKNLDYLFSVIYSYVNQAMFKSFHGSALPATNVVFMQRLSMFMFTKWLVQLSSYWSFHVTSITAVNVHISVFILELTQLRASDFMIT